jgi:hypothetical protein
MFDFISLDGRDILEVLKLLGAADQLQLQELADYLQAYLIENEDKWLYKHFEQVFQFSLQSNSLYLV